MSQEGPKLDSQEAATSVRRNLPRGRSAELLYWNACFSVASALLCLQSLCEHWTSAGGPSRPLMPLCEKEGLAASTGLCATPSAAVLCLCLFPPILL